MKEDEMALGQFVVRVSWYLFILLHGMRCFSFSRYV